MGFGSTETQGNGAAAPRRGAPRILLIIPCFNEEASIGGLLSEITAIGHDYHTLVVDDGSSDATAAVASRSSPVARLAQNLGIGGAVQTGIKYAARHDFDFCVQIDGDGQHDPRAIETLLNAYRKQPSNITIGSRFIDRTGFCSTRMRRAGIRLIVLALNGLFSGGGRITDPTSGMRLMDRTAIAFFAKAYPADFPEPISLAWAMRAGLTIGEVPVEMRARETGSSSIDGLKSASYMIRVLGYILLARLVRAS
ncbi:glycosyltransferase family 2 protein [Bradyrhizobium guangzhouense]|uniref:Glycosyltransferase family 2 protein n=1 Tax=Bradyrhizobium guangzhouense TaxID=1325095 RepID=A0AAE5X4K5_9BRAD|nr:glycosyltransferase family 2 protein [Bradyrhizobium guangzhouense]QAU48600.1 glycosyltransferase family 2 protein [Bradyrhizobium guangzhouense]RXH08359.1 glycosyltransferase family 2 protein [Bradyrhizobium guangzhouense]RXH08988.1 glycosyltransferase family 2 protein [Bradyrhizobium guangzhouense]